jgi:sec-independent protein translocase protein TatB
MLDVSFGEIAMIGAVALVVLGPERLPKVARTAGHLFGRLQRYVATVKADINREMELSDLAKVKQEVQEAARAFESTVQQHAQSIETEARTLQQETEKALADIPAVGEPSTAPTQAEILAGQEAGLDGMVASPALTQVSAPISPTAPQHVAVTEPAQGAFDFGIEPLRRTGKS